MDNWSLLRNLVPLELCNTVYMTGVSSLCALILGIPLGIVLIVTSNKQLKEHLFLYRILGTIVNIGRSFPFAILMVALIPFTRLVLGTSLGTTAAIVPLTIAAIPFVARLVETNLKEIDPHIIETAISMGSTTWQIVTKVFLPEALPGLISTATTTMVNLVGYSAMAGLVGGGGLGQVAIQYGYHQFNTCIMGVTVFLLILLVQAIQWGGNYLLLAVLQQRGLCRD